MAIQGATTPSASSAALSRYAALLGDTGKNQNSVQTVSPSTQLQDTFGVTNTSTDTNSNTNSTANSVTAQLGPEGLATLQNLISQLMGGGTANQKAEMGRIFEAQNLVKQLLGSYTTPKAMEDARGAMALNLKQSLEANMPAIQKAIEGAGTSANSMQALLSTKLANDSSLAASSLGADQAKTYAATTAQLLATLSSLVQPKDQVTQDLVSALSVLKGAVTSNTTTQNSNTRQQQNSVATNTQHTTTQDGGKQVSNNYTNNLLGSGGGQSIYNADGTINYAALASAPQGSYDPISVLGNLNRQTVSQNSDLGGLSSVYNSYSDWGDGGWGG